jgi:hypothetical protein
LHQTLSRVAGAPVHAAAPQHDDLMICTCSSSNILSIGLRTRASLRLRCGLVKVHGTAYSARASSSGAGQQQQQQQQQQRQRLRGPPTTPSAMAVAGGTRAPSAALASLDDYRIVSNIDASAVPEALKKDCILFYTPETEPLARKIAAQGQHVTLGNIRWK